MKNLSIKDFLCEAPKSNIEIAFSFKQDTALLDAHVPDAETNNEQL